MKTRHTHIYTHREREKEREKKKLIVRTLRETKVVKYSPFIACSVSNGIDQETIS
jgi:hypothetical protein